MRLFLRASVPLLMVAGLTIAFPARADLTLAQQANAAWALRADPAETQKAYMLWIQALKENPSQNTLWISLVRAGSRITRHTDNKDEQRRWAERTRQFAENAVKNNPQSSEAYAYLGEALGQWADANKGLGSLKVVRQAVEALQKAVELDPKNSHAHMLLSEFYRQAPSGISVGNKAKAFDEAKLAVEAGPQYAINHLALAEIYSDRGEKTLAIEQLHIILALPAPADAIPETQADQETARGMLQKLGGTPTPSGELPLGGACSASPGLGDCQSKTP